MGVKKKLVIHAHFYQPPRYNPFTGIVSEDTGSYYTSYNQKITDECYGPLAVKQIKYKNDLYPLYPFLSFNFGPTLLKYIEDNFPKLYISIINSDTISAKIFRYPSAIAQIYNHAIMPLLTPYEKKLQIKWAKESFKRAFMRDAEGLWLSETAFDNKTLEALIDEDIKFTISSPHQIKKAWKISDKNKTISDIGSGMYLWRSKKDPSKSIVIFVFDENLSKLSFSELWNTEKFIMRVRNSFVANNISLIATDGENYGHHIKKGDYYLARFIEKILKSDIELTNLSSLYHTYQPEYEVEINENTSWSCKCGIKRWMDQCECRINPSIKYQKWKKTLKKAADLASEISHKIFVSHSLEFLKNPHQTLEKYITLYEKPQPHMLMLFLENNSKKGLSHHKLTEILRLLKMEVSAAFSKTSCGFFFDDITGIESVNNIRNIIYVLHMAKSYGYDEKDINEIKELIRNEKSNFNIDLKEFIDKLIKECEDAYKIYAVQNAALHYLNFHLCLTPSFLKIKIYQDSLYIFHTIITDIYTFQTFKYDVEISDEKSNLIFRVKSENGEKDIISVKELPADIQNLIEILRSSNTKDKMVKDFLYILSNSNIPDKIISSYIDLIKNNLAHKLPYSYEIATYIISLAKNYSKLQELKNAILDSELESLMWKINLYMEKP